MVRELITKLGGVSAVSKRLNITRQSIYYWIDADRIPETSAFKLSHTYGLPLEEVGLAEYGKT
jgi:hypothetical protein